MEQVPAWVRDPPRESVRELDLSLGRRNYRLTFRSRELLELTELVNGEEVLVARESSLWRLIAMDLRAGAFDDQD